MPITGRSTQSPNFPSSPPFSPILDLIKKYLHPLRALTTVYIRKLGKLFAGDKEDMQGLMIQVVETPDSLVCINAYYLQYDVGALFPHCRTLPEIIIYKQTIDSPSIEISTSPHHHPHVPACFRLVLTPLPVFSPVILICIRKHIYSYQFLHSCFLSLLLTHPGRKPLINQTKSSSSSQKTHKTTPQNEIRSPPHQRLPGRQHPRLPLNPHLPRRASPTL